MRKRNKGRKFSRIRDLRRALLAGLAASLFLHERMISTEAKVKEARSLIEKLITVGKKQTLASLRELKARLPEKAALKVYKEIAPRMKSRAGGYTRVRHLPLRRGDAARMAMIELVDYTEKPKKKY